jgi:hypothetical protein
VGVIKITGVDESGKNAVSKTMQVQRYETAGEVIKQHLPKFSNVKNSAAELALCYKDSFNGMPSMRGLFRGKRRGSKC